MSARSWRCSLITIWLKFVIGKFVWTNLKHFLEIYRYFEIFDIFTETLMIWLKMVNIAFEASSTIRLLFKKYYKQKKLKDLGEDSLKTKNLPPKNNTFYSVRLKWSFPILIICILANIKAFQCFIQPIQKYLFLWCI